jgi:PAS domain S-box-containing protein
MPSVPPPVTPFGAFVPARGPFVQALLPGIPALRRIPGVDACDTAAPILGPEATGPPAPDAVLEALADGVLVADGRGRIVFVNPAAERLLGWSAGALIGERLVAIIPPRLRDAHRRGIARRLAGGESRLAGRVLRVPVMRPDGTEVPVEMSLSSTAAGPDGGQCFLATIRGIGARVELETVVAQELFGVLSEDLGRRDTVSRMLQALAESLAWDIAALWVVGADGTLGCEEVWHSASFNAPGFLFATRNRRFKTGAGLVGRVWETGHPAWVVDLSADMASSRAVAAAGEGVRSGVAFPVLAGHRILGVIELFSREHREPDAGLVAAMAAVGARLGDLLERITPADRARERPPLPDQTTSGDRPFRELGETDGTEPEAVKPGPVRPGLRVPAIRGEAILLLPPRDILYAEAAGRDVWLETSEGRLRAFERGLGALEGRLSPAGFLRVHRHFLVNLDLVRELVPAFKGAFWVVLQSTDRILIPVSRRRVADLWQAMGIDPRSGNGPAPTADTVPVSTVQRGR